MSECHERFSSLGVEVSVTELDIMAGTNSVMTEKRRNSSLFVCSIDGSLQEEQ